MLIAEKSPSPTRICDSALSPHAFRAAALKIRPDPTLPCRQRMPAAWTPGGNDDVGHAKLGLVIGGFGANAAQEPASLGKMLANKQEARSKHAGSPGGRVQRPSDGRQGIIEEGKAETGPAR